MSSQNTTFVDIPSRLTYLSEILTNGNVAALAKKAGIKGGTLHNYIKGRPPSSESLIYICRNLDVNLNWLLDGRGTPFIERGTDEASGAEPDASADIDIDILAGVIQALENYLKAGRLTLDPAPKARLLAVLYDHFADTGETANKKTIARFIRLVA